MKVDIYIYGDENTPSSRLRWINYKECFAECGIEYNVFKLKDYIKKGILIKRPLKSDIIVIQKKPLNKLLITLFKSRCKQLIFDIDDAIWMSHSRENFERKSIRQYIWKRNFINTLKCVDNVIVSNEYIEKFVNRYNKNIKIIPTNPSDREIIYNEPKKYMDINNKFIIGWTGSKENLFYVKEIETYIKDFFKNNEDAYLLIISNEKYISYDKLFNEKIINIEWSLVNESYYLNKFDIGIMPNSNDSWVLGKAAYKLIYYMKNSIPTIATNWGYQTSFIRNLQNGLLVQNNQEWEEALKFYYLNKTNRDLIGKEGFNTYNKLFEKRVIFKKYLEIFRNIKNI